MIPGALALLAKRCGPAMRFLLIFALVVASPVLVLGTRFESAYAYNVWPSLAVGAVLALSTVRTAWLSGPGCLWLALLGILRGSGATIQLCAVSAAMAAAAQKVPRSVCSARPPLWHVPRELAADHMARWRALTDETANFDYVPAEALRCLKDDSLDNAQKWRCSGGDLPEGAARNYMNAPIPILRQLLAARCGRLDVRMKLAGLPPGPDPDAGRP